jgi:hypothetical protein
MGLDMQSSEQRRRSIATSSSEADVQPIVESVPTSNVFPAKPTIDQFVTQTATTLRRALGREVPQWN